MRTLLLACLGLLLTACSTSPRPPDPVATVEAFRAARERGDLAAARALLADDPRVWYTAREGAGTPWTLGAGRWTAWDDEFDSASVLGPWQVEGDAVWAIATETNDYYRLTEREGVSRYRITYFLDDAGRLEGYLISPPDPAAPSPPLPSRIDEIEAWAQANHPDEWAYLRPGGSIDPTGDRAARTRRLINTWRREVGLPPIE